MVSNQLLSKRIFFPTIPEFGVSEDVRQLKFNLGRGKMARVLGFNVAWLINGVDQLEPHQLVVVKDVIKTQPATPDPSALWIQSTMGAQASQSYTLPKPFRTNSLSVYAWAIDTNQSSCVLIVYYDIDDMKEGEDIQVMESTKQRGRRTL